MCDPITMAGLGLSAASTLANSEAQNQVAGARRGVMNAEAFRQSNWDNENTGTNTAARNRYADANGQGAAREKEIADYYKTNSGPLPTGSVTSGTMPQSSSNITVQEGQKQGEKTSAFNTQQNEASAKLRSFGDIMGTAARGNAMDAGQLGVVNGFKRGSAGVVPMELETAGNAGNGMKTFADILGGAGKVATFAGLSGLGNGAAGATPASMAVPHGAVATKTPMATGGNWFSRLFGG